MEGPGTTSTAWTDELMSSIQANAISVRATGANRWALRHAGRTDGWPMVGLFLFAGAQKASIVAIRSSICEDVVPAKAEPSS